MFERFTDRARRVVVLAQEEARTLNHGYIGTEHILLGLLREPQGVAARALEALGVSLTAARAEVEQMIGRGEGMPDGHIPFTPRAKKVLELSLREALTLEHNYIGTEHILLGLIREQEGVAAQALSKLGVGESQVRAKVLELLRTATPGEAEAEDTGKGLRRARAVDVGRSITIRLDDLLTRLERIEHRLTRIERTLDRPQEPQEPAAGTAQGSDPEPGGSAGPEPGAGPAHRAEPPAAETPAAEPPPGEPPAAEPSAGEPPAAEGSGG
jgi:ATP-dependent Clp protease ATP-binding subunit ClpC